MGASPFVTNADPVATACSSDTASRTPSSTFVQRLVSSNVDKFERKVTLCEKEGDRLAGQRSSFINEVVSKLTRIGGDFVVRRVNRKETIYGSAITTRK
jgi:hypothetical protein